MGVAVRIPKEVADMLEREARRRGKTLLQMLLEAAARSLDPETRVKLHLSLHETYLKEAREAARKGDQLQASEKYWGAVAALLNAIGELEGLPHYTHRDLKEIAARLTEKTGDPDYTRLFSSVETLHANFYHSFLGEKSFRVHQEDAERLVVKLRSYLERLAGQATQ